MKILKEAPQDIVYKPAYWLGLRFVCNNCKSELELDNDDDATPTFKWKLTLRPFSLKKMPYLDVYCPVCEEELQIPDHERPK